MKQKILYLVVFISMGISAQTAYPPSSLSYCDEDNDGFGIFILTDATPEVLGGQSPSDFTVTYHETLAQANTGVASLASPYMNIIAYTQTLYVRLEENATGAYDTTTLDLNVVDSPVLPSEELVLSLCDTDGTADGFTVFNLTYIEAELLADVVGSPFDYMVTYYLTEADAEAGFSPIATPTAFVNTTPSEQIIYAAVTNVINGCTRVKEITLRVDIPPTALYTNIYQCDDGYWLEMDGIYTFNLVDFVLDITAGAPDVEVSFYTVESDAIAGGGTSLITTPEAFDNTVNPQNIFARVFNPTTGCYAVTMVTLRVEPNPTPLKPEQIVDNLGVMEVCDNEVEGSGAIEEQRALFDLTIWEMPILTGEGPGPEPGVSLAYYESYDDAVVENNPILTPEAYTNIANTQTIYVRVTNDTTGCYTITWFDIFVKVCELPYDNFTVEATSETCVDMDNGAINITANEPYLYEVSLTFEGTAVPLTASTFTENLSIANLAPGTYYLCVTVPDIEQCFEINVGAVEDLIGFSGRVGNQYSLELSGATYYEIDINGEIETITSSSSEEIITFHKELTAIENYISVTSDKECQGAFEEYVELSENKMSVYPNPANNFLYVTLPNQLSNGILKMYSISGKLVKSKELSGNLKYNLNLKNVAPGVYVVKIESAKEVYVSKFIKQ